MTLIVLAPCRRRFSCGRRLEAYRILEVEGRVRRTAVKRADGKWEVTVLVEAKKFNVDSRGGETETPLAEHIEVGLFGAQRGLDAVDRKNVIVVERRPIRSGAQVLKFVTDRKPTHGATFAYTATALLPGVDTNLLVQPIVSVE